MSKNAILTKEAALIVVVLFIGLAIILSNDSIGAHQTSLGSGKTLYVGGNGSGNYSKIQDAIDNASDDDTVFVYSGTYYENILINKTIHLIGENIRAAVIDGRRLGDVVKICANRVNITSFTIQNSSGESNGGITLKNATGNTIYYNLLINNKRFGICLGSSSEFNVITGNFITYNTNGIYIESSANYNVITDNDIALNNFDGICSLRNSENQITENRMMANMQGVSLREGTSITISNNIILYMGKTGIYLDASKRCTISNNKLEYNKVGICLANSYRNTIQRNNFINKRDIFAYFIAYPGLHLRNRWISNYWDGWSGFGPKVILGKMWVGKYTTDPRYEERVDVFIPWINIDWHPAQEPYKIP